MNAINVEDYLKLCQDFYRRIRDYEGFRTDMITGLQKRIPEYTDISQSDAGIAGTAWRPEEASGR